MKPRNQIPGRRSIAGPVYVAICVGLSLYFGLFAVQGNYGLLRRIQVESETQDLRVTLDGLNAQIKEYKNKIHRLSNVGLDLDLLDEQVRLNLGYARADEIILQ